MTVQELIDILNRTSDKDRSIRMFMYAPDGAVVPVKCLVESSIKNERWTVYEAKPNETFYILREE